jgi:hypothetical protein
MHFLLDSYTGCVERILGFGMILLPVGVASAQTPILIPEARGSEHEESTACDDAVADRVPVSGPRFGVFGVVDVVRLVYD